MTRITTASAGLDALRRRLDELPLLAQAAVGPALHDLAERAGEDLDAVLPAGTAVIIEDAADGSGSRLVVTGPAARALEFGTSWIGARPVLRPAAAAAAEATKPALGEALRAGLAGGRP